MKVMLCVLALSAVSGPVLAQARRPTPPPPARPLKVLVLHDMEGLSGQDDWRTFNHEYTELYAKGRQFLVDDVNAVVAGLFDGGATAVEVVDGHGSGNTEPDIPLERLDARAKHIFRMHPFDPYVDLVAPGVYDAVALVGMHSKPGSGGFAAHTVTSGMTPMMNGMGLTEPELVGYSFGRANIPVVFVAGDDKLWGDIESTMPWVQYVVTKRSTSASTANLRSLDSVHTEMRVGAKQAMLDLDRARSMKLELPIQAGLKATPPASLAFLDSVPGVNYKNNQVSFVAQNFGEAYRGIMAYIRVASIGGALPVFQEFIASQPNGPELQRQLREFRVGRWMDYESGRWTPPPPKPPAQKRFHGDN